jgi:RNA polymerase sigma-70 factor (ECF subfamily)
LPEDNDEQPSLDPLPDAELSERERGERVRAMLAELPEDQSAVVQLAFVEGLSHSEIAKRLGLPLGTVNSRMRLAYQKIRDALEDLR